MLAKCLIINVLRLILVILFFIAFLNITYAARHTFATTVTLANNVPLQEVSAMLGHASTRMTQHYARVMDRNLKDNMNIVRSKMGL
ncbi:tyrosine-type recombinase/integrase [Phocaeicola vulgatus]|uniref:tyrosine-type recombinase/integrase n=1 Tax=Phocaeicola vulgatus TaxID=821 RepID=UPI00286F67F6|nr:tyrosine-type recombinase/integrase [Phocaeicola vulgatus]